MNIALGDRVKDKITGFIGVAISITHWINGCTRVQIQPQTLKEDGAPTEAQVFDEPQVEVVEKAALAAVPDEEAAEPVKAVGGPCPKPMRAKDPE